MKQQVTSSTKSVSLSPLQTGYQSHPHRITLPSPAQYEVSVSYQRKRCIGGQTHAITVSVLTTLWFLSKFLPHTSINMWSEYIHVKSICNALCRTYVSSRIVKSRPLDAIFVDYFQNTKVTVFATSVSQKSTRSPTMVHGAGYPNALSCFCVFLCSLTLY